ncbi:MAG: hypothetical protein Q8R02_10445 [Hyphomonadaceae bacterium]|nr:hypothetical protein [Hyphomonadaceae bacterium]
MSDKPEVDGFTNKDLNTEGTKAAATSVDFAFDFPKLREAFKKPDEEAAAARLVSRIIGVTGVLLVLAALMLASAGPMLGHGATVTHDEAPAARNAAAAVQPAAAPHAVAKRPQLSNQEKLIGSVAAVMGLLGTAMGLYGMGRGSPRHRWLRARLKTETLRLFQFHYLAARLPEIVSNAFDPEWRKRFEKEREEMLEEVQQKLLADPDKELARITKGKGETTFESFIQPQPASLSSVNSKVEEDAIAAWRELRLGWQETYVKTKLLHKDKRGLTARGKEHLFAVIGWACVGLIIFLHLLHFLGVLAEWPIGLMEMAVIWTALVALAGRALEDGYAPHREVERYEQYEGNIRVAIERFEEAQGFAAKLEVARAFERTSLEEMRVFIRTQAKTRFLL